MNFTKITNLFNSSTSSDLETQELGVQFSKFIKNGDIMTLNGNLGSGKTTFVKGVLMGLGYKDEVTSPTYTLINEYKSKYNIIHLDCYREKDINRWLNIGLIDYFNNQNILPDKTKNLFFEVIGSNKRMIKYYE